MTRIVVTGDRNWKNREFVYEVLYSHLLARRQLGLLDPVILTHGDADGADKMAGWATRELNASSFNIIEDPHPAEWYKTSSTGKVFFDKGAGQKRNSKMLNLQDPPPSLVIGFHNDIESSKGTKNCVLGAIQRRIDVALFAESPDGFRTAMILGDDFQGIDRVSPSLAERTLIEAAHRLRPMAW